MMKKLALCLLSSAVLAVTVSVFSGCASREEFSSTGFQPGKDGKNQNRTPAQCDFKDVLAAEDIEVPVLYKDLIDVLKDPKIRPNSKEKYEAINELLKHVDFTLTRETKTLNDLLSYRDAIVEDQGKGSRLLTFNYQYGDHYTRLRFFVYNIFIHRVDVIQE